MTTITCRGCLKALGPHQGVTLADGTEVANYCRECATEMLRVMAEVMAR